MQEMAKAGGRPAKRGGVEATRRGWELERKKTRSKVLEEDLLNQTKRTKEQAAIKSQLSAKVEELQKSERGYGEKV